MANRNSPGSYDVTELDDALGNPNVQKFLHVLSSAEGTAKSSDPYRVAFGGGQIDDLSEHPNIRAGFTQTDGRKNFTTAAGKYQFLKSTWDDLANKYGLDDFGPQNQDRGAVALLARNGALDDIVNGDFKSAVQKSGSTWASLPSSPYAQNKRSDSFIDDALGGGGGTPAKKKLSWDDMKPVNGFGGSGSGSSSSKVSWDDMKPVVWKKDEEDKPPAEEQSAFRRLGDAGISLAKGVVGLPESLVGVADLVTGGRAGKLAEDAGIRFKDTKNILSELYSDKQKAANKEVDQADGFLPTLGAMVKNPTTIVNAALESVPSMLAGGAVSRGTLALAPKIGAITAGAIGEGAIAAGQNAEQVRQEDPSGTLTAGQSAILAASGALTGGISRASGALANKLGIGDLQTMMAAGKLGPVGEQAVSAGAGKGLLRKAAEGFAVEGALQELPQSYQEQIAQNIAQGKPWDEGAGKAAGQGLLVGGLTGGLAGPLSSGPTHAVPGLGERPATVGDIMGASGVDEAIAAASNLLDAPKAANGSTSPDISRVLAENAGSGSADPLEGLATRMGPGAADALPVGAGSDGHKPAGFPVSPAAGANETPIAPEIAQADARIAEPRFSLITNPDGTIQVRGDPAEIKAALPGYSGITNVGGVTYGTKNAAAVQAALSATSPNAESAMRSAAAEGVFQQERTAAAVKAEGQSAEENLSGQDPMFSRRADRPVNLPEAIIGNELGSASSHPDYIAAKSGDVRAAVNVAHDLVTDNMVSRVKQAVGNEDALIVPIVSIEESGKNKIPSAAARVLAEKLGLDVGRGIVQSSSPKRTGLNGLERIFSQPEFEGKIEPGRAYVLVDDTLTQGATFAALASHIEQAGGRVVASVALTGKQYSATLKASDPVLAKLRNKHGDLEPQFRAATGFGFDGLTQSEARYLANYEPAQSVRNRITQAGSDAGRRVDQADSGPETPSTRRSFAGQRAATADTHALDSAQSRLNAGENPEAVRQDTGWSQSAEENLSGKDSMFSRSAQAIESIKQSSEISASEKIKLAAELRKGNVTPEDVAQMLGSSEPEISASAPKEVVKLAGQRAATADTRAPDSAQPSLTDPFSTKQEANRASLKERGTIAVQADNGGWLLTPRTRAYNEQEIQDAQAKVDALNPALERAGVAPAQVLRDAPTGPMVYGSRIARMLGYDVTFIERNKDFDGVSLGGQAFVSPSTKHPEIGLIGHEVMHSFKRTDPAQYEALAEQIRHYLKDGVVDAKRQWEASISGKDAGRVHAEDEVLADLNGSMWTDPKFWREMSANDPSLFRQVAYKFMEVATRVMQGLSRFKADDMVTDVAAVRKLIAQEWAYQAQENRAEPGKGDQPSFSRTTLSDYARHATDKLNENFSHPGKLSLWDKTVGSMYHLAERSPPFKRVFDAAQSFINDVSYYATESANLAPKILPKLDTWRDMLKTPVSAADNKSISAPILEGTLSWGRDESGKPVRIDDLEATYAKLDDEAKAQMLLKKRLVTEDQLKRWKGSALDVYTGAVRNRFEAGFLQPGVVWSDAELQSMFSLNPAQIGLYREFRSATDKSLDNLAKADLLRFGGKDVAGVRDMVMEAKDADEAAVLLRDYLMSAAGVDPTRADALNESANGMVERADKVNSLKARGYAPLSRFGRYSVDVVVNGKREYFSLFESQRAANLMAIKLKNEFGEANVAQGTLSQKEFEQFQGITPESLELFGNMLGLDSTGNEAQDKAFQTYLKLTKTNRSAMKRMIHRKGTAGFSEDMGRVLAAFVYSNARQTSAALHMGELGEAVNNIPKGQGELKDAAIELSSYIKQPREEAHALRGLLFAQYLGGSVASAFVNFTQPLTVSFPYLSQFGGAGKAGKALIQAMQDQRAGVKLEAGLATALHLAEERGTVSPQSVHELMAQAQGRAVLNSGDGSKTGDALAFGKNNFAKLALGWGKLFGLAEQINRRSTFIAAYRIAVEQKIANPAAFATKAVNETQFISNKANKAKFGRGAIGATLMTFKSYSVNYLELLHRMATQNGPEGKKAAALMLGMLFLMAGAGGLPFTEDLEDVADFFAQRLGYNFSSKKAKQEFLQNLLGKPFADFVDKGISGLPGSPIDTSGRMSMGNLIPGTGLLLKKTDHTGDVQELFGPAGDLVKRGFQAGDQLLSGNIAKAAKTLAPKAVYNMAKGADMASTGAYRDDKGFKVLETTPFEAAMKAIGFQPASVAEVQQSNYLHQRAKDFYNQNAQDINARYAKGIFEKDQEQIAQARDMLQSWNERNPEQRINANLPAILRKAREMAKTKDERIDGTAPKAMRQQMRRESADIRAAQM